MNFHFSKNFLIELDPLGEMSEKDFNDYLYEKSLTLEPRNSKQASKFVSILLISYLNDHQVRHRTGGVFKSV